MSNHATFDSSIGRIRTAGIFLLVVGLIGSVVDFFLHIILSRHTISFQFSASTYQSL